MKSHFSPLFAIWQAISQPLRICLLALCGACLNLPAYAAGEIDATFGDGRDWGPGKILLNRSVDDEAYKVVVQPDGNVVFAGVSWNNAAGRNNYDWELNRYLSNGTPDYSFNTDGLPRVPGQGFGVITSFGEDARVDGLALQSDGKIIVAGHARINGRYQVAVVRYLKSSVLDSSFGVNGKFTMPFGTKEDGIGGGAIIEPGGKILVGGSAQDAQGLDGLERISALLVQLTSAGALDFGRRAGEAPHSRVLYALNHCFCRCRAFFDQPASFCHPFFSWRSTGEYAGATVDATASSSPLR